MMTGMKRMVVIAWIFALGMAVVGGRQVEAAERVRINGSGSALALMQPLAEAYQKSHPEVSFEMGKPLGSSGAIKALLAGALEIAVSSKKLKPEEVAAGATEREYGQTPLALVTEKSVSKTNITTGELESIYAGTVTTWPGGVPIRVILRPEADIDTVILRGLSPGMDSALTAAHSRPGMIVAVTDPESNSMVAKTPGAIGAAGLSGVLLGPDRLKILTLNSVEPTVKSLMVGKYPLAKSIAFITTAKPTAAALKFLDFVYSPEGRAIAERAGVLMTNAGTR